MRRDLGVLFDFTPLVINRKKRSLVIKRKLCNAWTVKIGEGRGPWGPIPEIMVHYLNQIHFFPAKQHQVVDPGVLSNFDSPGVTHFLMLPFFLRTSEHLYSNEGPKPQN